MNDGSPIKECTACGSLTPWTRCPCCNGSRFTDYAADPHNRILVGSTYDLVQCPNCRWIGSGSDGFDGMGVEPPHDLACARCGHEFQNRDGVPLITPLATDLRRQKELA